METKSRYEVIADLEKQKRDLIREREGFKDTIKQLDYEVLQIERGLEDKKKAVDEFKNEVEERKETIKELIEGVNESLARFGKLTEQK